MRALFDSPHRLRSLQWFSKPLLRGAFRHLPEGVKRVLRTHVQGRNIMNNTRLDFSAVYRDNGFAGTESLSGSGSTLFQTRIIRRELPLLFRRLSTKRVLDIPCGDFHWMCEVNLAGVHYIGADVVEEMVAANQRRFGAGEREFKCVDLILGPLPAADLVLCRDCLVHLPFDDALSAIDTIRKSRCQWLLTTTFTGTDSNQELDDAGWRPLNLTLPPFNFPPPELLISEKCTEAGGLAGDKALGLWRIVDLKAHKRT
jgi:SAM-dependent methyltransferase